MAKKNMKVDLERYMSPEEKIKRSFIFSCTILVILTFLIFITYSFFINNTGEKDVGNVQATNSSSDVVFYEAGDSEYIIKNNSNTNAYSYNLSYKESESCSNDIYYKIPSDGYSHAKGIIKPGEEKRVYIINKSNCDINSQNLKINSGYEYSPVKVSTGYQEIKYLNTSNLEHETELEYLWVDNGWLEPEFNKYTLEYNLCIYEDIIGDTADSITEINFEGSLLNNGYITGEKAILTDDDIIKHKIKVYAEDGTYIQTYTINIIRKDTYRGKIKMFKLEDLCHTDEHGNPLVISKAYKENGFENNDEINFHIDDLNNYICQDNHYYTYINWQLSYNYLTSSKSIGNYIFRLHLANNNAPLIITDAYDGYVNINFTSNNGDFLQHFSVAYMDVVDYKLSDAEEHIDYTYGINIS